MNITELKVKRNRLTQELREVKSEIDEYEETIELPKLKEKYEGKYFKYRNSYGGDLDRWWLYIKVIEVLSSYRIRVYTFQKDSLDKYEITLEESSLTILQEEITEEEFITKHDNFIDNLPL